MTTPCIDIGGGIVITNFGRYSNTAVILIEQSDAKYIRGIHTIISTETREGAVIPPLYHDSLLHTT